MIATIRRSVARRLRLAADRISPPPEIRVTSLRVSPVASAASAGTSITADELVRVARRATAMGVFG